jgi:argininosuccinate synthase
MELLGSCYGLLLELILDRRARELYDTISRQVSRQIYQGYWFDLATSMALQALEPVTRIASGTIAVTLYKGAVRYAGATDVTSSLYDPEQSSMESVGSFDHADSEGFLRVLGISARALAYAGQVRG